MSRKVKNAEEMEISFIAPLIANGSIWNVEYHE